MKLPNRERAIIAQDKIVLHTDVGLVRDVPEKTLRAGDVGTVVEQRNKSVGVTLRGSYLREPTHADCPAVRVESVAV
jgi:hypothetical protein